MVKRIKYLSIGLILVLMLLLTSCNLFKTSPPPAQPREADTKYYSYSIKDSTETEDYFICSFDFTIKEDITNQKIEEICTDSVVKTYPICKVVINNIEYLENSNISFTEKNNYIVYYIDKYEYFKNDNVNKNYTYSGTFVTSIILNNKSLKLKNYVTYDYTSVPESIRDKVVY